MGCTEEKTSFDGSNYEEQNKKKEQGKLRWKERQAGNDQSHISDCLRGWTS